MRKVLIGIGVAVLAAALGVGAAYGGSELVKTYRPEIVKAVREVRGPEAWKAIQSELENAASSCIPEGFGVFRERVRDRVVIIRERRTGWTGSGQGERITMDEAVQTAEDCAARMGDGFRVAEVMEFEKNFYAVIVEKESGRGALEILIDPYSGAVSAEMGPNRMWNGKYGASMHRSATPGENELSLEAAREAAQKYLDENLPGAKVEEGGYSFYGYYTFDYSVDGRTAGMLSVHGSTGEVWVHTWHGAFVAEEEMEQ